MAQSRVCDICAGIDTAPRHVITHGPGEAPDIDQAVLAKVIDNASVASDVRAAAVADLSDTTVQLRHMDCCASVGCPDGSCVAILRAAPGADVTRGQDLSSSDGVTRDDALLRFVTSGAVDNVGADLSARY